MQIKKRSRNSATVKIGGTDTGMSIKTYVRSNRKNLRKTHMTKHGVVKSGTLTKTQLERMIDNGTLKPIVFNNKQYFDRMELLEARKLL